MCRHHRVIWITQETTLTDELVRNITWLWVWCVISRSLESLKPRLSSFKKVCLNHYDIVNYIEDNWIPYKEIFVATWVHKHFYFECNMTNWVDGPYDRLKMIMVVPSSMTSLWCGNFVIWKFNYISLGILYNMIIAYFEKNLL